jgi:hypothetical protein
MGHLYRDRADAEFQGLEVAEHVGRWGAYAGNRPGVNAHGVCSLDIADALDHGVLGFEEYLRIQYIDGNRLWFGAAGSTTYVPGTRVPHFAGASVKEVVLTAKTVGKTFNWVEELQKEIDMLGKADKAWQTTSIAAEVLQELTVQKSLAEADAGKLARDRINRLATELKELSRDGIRIRYETLESQAGNVSAEARGEQISGDNKPEKIVVDDEHFMWKFNGEYWKDELGYYRFKIQSKCPTKR